MSKRKRKGSNITGSSKVSGFQVFARSNESDTLSVLKEKWMDMSVESKEHFNLIAKVWNEENSSRRRRRRRSSVSRQVKKKSKKVRSSHINETKAKKVVAPKTSTTTSSVKKKKKKTITENKKRDRSLDPDLVGLGWMEETFTFEGSMYIVYTGPYGLRCRNIEKAREMAFATRDLELTCCHRNSWAKTPSKSLENRSNNELRELLARYAKTTIEKVKSWKQSRDQMMKRLIREVDDRARKNRAQYKSTKKLDI